MLQVRRLVELPAGFALLVDVLHLGLQGALALEELLDALRALCGGQDSPLDARRAATTSFLNIRPMVRSISKSMRPYQLVGLRSPHRHHVPGLEQACGVLHEGLALVGVVPRGGEVLHGTVVQHVAANLLAPFAAAKLHPRQGRAPPLPVDVHDFGQLAPGKLRRAKEAAALVAATLRTEVSASGAGATQTRSPSSGP